MEIAAGFALATTSLDCHACVPKLHATKNPCVQALRRAGTSSRQSGTPRNDHLWLFEAHYFMLPLIIGMGIERPEITKSLNP